MRGRPQQAQQRHRALSIAQDEYARRRRQLMKMAGEDAVLLVAAAPERIRNADAAWPYRQDSDLHYLSGFPEPDAVLALLPGRLHGEAVLFCRERDDERERWHGESIGTERAVSEHGMDDAFPIDDIDDILPGMIEGRGRVYCHFGREPEFDARLLGWMRRLRQLRGGGVVPKEFVALGHLLHDLRLYKSRAELRLMRSSAAIAAEAHLSAMRMAQPGRHEYEVEAELVRTMRSRGAVPAFPPIVASGANACVMHYQANRAPLRDGDLLLIDAGAELDCYASDISRSFPLNGRYSREQRALYEVVLAAQQAAIDEVRPGRPFSAAHEAAVYLLAEGLCSLGLLQGDAETAIAEGSYKRFFPAKTGHWLGLDVHDVGDYRIDGEPRILEPGMVVTVEPGLYVPPGERSVHERWRGIGIRIEDDVAVTRDGNEVLTAAVPKEAEAIEALLAER
ncbi:aminopeptidase P N-terminal domain-containing protein [Dyella sp. LX-66]|uniref:aminopeptidase P N-terminal domain-containing protein n=1 Tax=unclassified Dyella TaxID=2634549 RepID=UPI001BDFE12F|nr:MULTISPECIES: aminopeptidase P N-terminal domain-containing protein [unclassified Dyella]MBT2115759.1 aminopeptidase P N-terminal domain-containing protein [Dyella sp. LX-1]MBT2139574.1 aminopeptidase P N-terminal domain-containing protein [Dyella sp. LX-66]